MSDALTPLRAWAARRQLLVCCVVAAIAGVIGAWDMLETRFIAAFAEGGTHEEIPPAIPLWAIGVTGGLLAAASTGYGRRLRDQATTFVLMACVTGMAWLPSIIVFLLAWPGLLWLGVVHGGGDG